MCCRRTVACITSVKTGSSMYEEVGTSCHDVVAEIMHLKRKRTKETHYFPGVHEGHQFGKATFVSTVILIPFRMNKVLYIVGLNSQIQNNHMEAESVGYYENQLHFDSMEVLNRPKKRKDPRLSTDGNLILIFIMTRRVTGGTGITGPGALKKLLWSHLKMGLAHQVSR